MGLHTPTRQMRRDEVRPGMVRALPHGRILITEIDDGAVQRSDDREVGFIGRIGGDLRGELVAERAAACETVAIEVPLRPATYRATPTNGSGGMHYGLKEGATDGG